MIKTFEAVVDDRGNVKLLEPVHLKSGRRAFVLILDEPADHDNGTAILSEAALSDWTKPEEDAAWSHLLSGNGRR
ncbi:MAG: hypothetical protein LAP85_17140 [Acidobacteriia bacterium]|nr:hypothetical protein [Terriglobia bacterium]